MKASTRWAVVALVVAAGACLLYAGTQFTKSQTYNRVSHSRCPWASPLYASTKQPEQLAAEVATKMTLQEKARMVTFATKRNIIIGVPRLCIANQEQSPGSQQGIGATSRVQTATLGPAISLAASFDTTQSRAYGRILGVDSKATGTSFNATIDTNLDRLPNWGRIQETFGEDPFLAAVMTSSTTIGLHAENELVVLRHFGPYGQENERHTLNVRIPQADLLNQDLAPFYKSVTSTQPAARPDGLMCSYGEINNTPACADTALFNDLRQKGFNGFIRTDMGTLFNPITLLRGGSDITKPGSPKQVLYAVRHKQLAESTLTTAVVHILTPFFAHHVATIQLHQHPLAQHTLQTEQAFGVKMLERGAVLLKNANDLPLAPQQPVTIIATGQLGTTCTALADDVNHLGHAATCYDTAKLLPHSTQLVAPQQRTVLPNGVALRTAPATKGTSVTVLASTKTDQAYLVTSILPGGGRGTATVAGPTRSCTLVSGSEINTPCSFAITVPANQRASITVRSNDSKPPSVYMTPLSTTLHNLQNRIPPTNHVLVLAGSTGTEGFDRASLGLDDAGDYTIGYFANRNPTDVYLYGSGPVAMPWLSAVRAVTEMWVTPTYTLGASGSILAQRINAQSARSAATATANLLTGKVSPSGKLPITFPTSLAQSPAATVWPGKQQASGRIVDLTLLAGLGTGYQWYQATNTHPLFPFGYGLSYTTFTTTNQHVVETPTGLLFSADVKNEGAVSTNDILEIYATYLHAPANASRNLVGFAAPYVRAGHTSHVSVQLPYSVFSTSALTVGDGTSHEPVTIEQAPDALAPATYRATQNLPVRYVP